MEFYSSNLGGSELASCIFIFHYGPSREDVASKQIKISHFRVFIRMKQIDTSDLTVGLIKLEAHKRSQHGPKEANNVYCGFSLNKASGEIY